MSQHKIYHQIFKYAPILKVQIRLSWPVSVIKIIEQSLYAALHDLNWWISIKQGKIKQHKQ